MPLPFVRGFRASAFSAVHPNASKFGSRPTKTPNKGTRDKTGSQNQKTTISKVDFSDFYWTPRHEKGRNCKVLCGSWAASKCPATRIKGQKIRSLYRALIPCMSFQRLPPLIAQLHTRSQVLWDKISHQFPNQFITGKVISVSIPESCYFLPQDQRCTALQVRKGCHPHSICCRNAFY